MNITKTSIILTLALGISFLSSPAKATPTPVVETTCIWSGNDGSLMKQKCRIFGNSSAGFGSGFYITWEDGMKTTIRDSSSSGNFITPDSKKKVEIYGEFIIGRMALPRQIHIDGLGIVVITYQNYFTSKNY